MALRKTITLPSGHFCEYWRIVEIRRDWLNGTGAVIVAGYRDESARRGELAPSSDARVAFEGYLGLGAVADAYSWVQQQPSLVPAHRAVREIEVPMPSANPDEPPIVETRVVESWVPATAGPPIFADAEDC